MPRGLKLNGQRRSPRAAVFSSCRSAQDVAGARRRTLPPKRAMKRPTQPFAHWAGNDLRTLVPASGRRSQLLESSLKRFINQYRQADVGAGAPYLPFQALSAACVVAAARSVRALSACWSSRCMERLASRSCCLTLLHSAPGRRPTPSRSAHSVRWCSSMDSKQAVQLAVHRRLRLFRVGRFQLHAGP